MINLKWLLYALFFLFIGKDVFERFINNSETTLTNGGSVKNNSYLPQRQSPDKAHAMLIQYEKLNPSRVIVTPNNKSTNDRLSISEQQKQQGILNEFYSGDSIISLKAVIDDKHLNDKMFALLEVRNIDNNTALTVKTNIGEEFRGYIVKSLKLNQIIFTNLKDVTKHITLPLYLTTNKIMDTNESNRAGNE